MKKYIIFLLVCILSMNRKVYGFDIPVQEFKSVYNFILLEDIYFLNEQYMQDPELDIKEAAAILLKCYQKYADITIDSDYVLRNYDVIGPDGYADYQCCYINTDSSYGIPSYMFLMSNLTEECIYLNEPWEEIEKYLERNDEIAGKIREQYFYVINNLQEDEYGGMYYKYDYESSSGQLSVMLTDESRASLLEKAGISWEKTETSRVQMYEKMQYLWKERENLNLTKVEINMYSDTLGIWGYDTEEEFVRKLDKGGFERDYYILAEYYNITDQDTISEYIANKKICSTLSDDYWEKLQKCLEQMEKMYPEYIYENFYTLVFLNCDYEKYSGFEEELEELVASIPYHENQKNPFDEERYGDPEQLALKVMLTEYKTVYPEMSYQELYEKYGKEINESKILTQEEKRSRYLWESVKAEQLGKEDIQEQKADRESYASAAAGIAVLIIGIVVIAVMKRKQATAQKF